MMNFGCNFNLADQVGSCNSIVLHPKVASIFSIYLLCFEIAHYRSKYNLNGYGLNNISRKSYELNMFTFASLSKIGEENL